MTVAQRLAMQWWSLGAGVLLFLAPLLTIGHLVMTVRDHKRHGSWPVTGLAVLWPVVCIAGIGVLEGNLSPPLFGVPLLLLMSTAWLLSPGRFAFGVVAFYLLSAIVVAVSLVAGDGKLNGWYGIFWPVSFAALMLWRRGRLEALAEAP